MPDPRRLNVALTRGLLYIINMEIINEVRGNEGMISVIVAVEDEQGVSADKKCAW